MSTALSLVGIHRQSTEELSFAEIEEQHAELLPSRTVLSMMTSNPVPADIVDNIADDILTGDDISVL